MNGPQQIKECRERMASYTPEQREKLNNLRHEILDQEPVIVPTILFDEETANSINWKQYYPY